MKLFSCLFLILLVLEEFNCAPPLFDWSSEREPWRIPGHDCGFGGRFHYFLHSRPWLFRNYSENPYYYDLLTYLPDYETMYYEDQLSKETEDQLSNETVDKLSKKSAEIPSNKNLDKLKDIPTKPLIKPLIDISSKTLDEASRKFIDKPSTKSTESPLENLSDYEKISPFDDIPTENLDTIDFSQSF